MNKPPTSQRNTPPVIILSLPFPISENAMYRNARGGGKRHKSERYRIWLRAAMNEAAAQKQKPITGKFNVEIHLGRPDRRRRDSPNYIKAPLDLLVKMGLVDDDSDTEWCLVGWSTHTKPKTATVLVWPAEQQSGRVA